MKDRFFVDTNVFVYAVLENEDEKIKIRKAIELFEKLQGQQIFISTQILNEFHNSLIKHNIPEKVIHKRLNTIISNCTVSLISVKTIKKSWRIRARYQFSIWDSLIIASALENKCSVLYTEDLQHNQIIEKRLRIINPFPDNP